MKEKNLKLDKEQQVIFNKYIKYAYKMAGIYAEQYNVDKEESISYALEGLAKAIKSYNPYNKNSKIQSWISLVIKSEIGMYARKFRKVSYNENVDMQDEIIQDNESYNLDTSIEYNEIMQVLDQTLKSYPEDEQQIFKEITFSKRTLMEVGEMFNISHTTVAKIVKKIRLDFAKSYYI